MWIFEISVLIFFVFFYLGGVMILIWYIIDIWDWFVVFKIYNRIIVN